MIGFGRVLGAFGILVNALASAVADPPANLQDAGDCGIDASQKRSVKSKKNEPWTGISFFEPGPKIAILSITNEDVRALDKEVTRLKANRCYTVCVRPLLTAKGLAQAAANCDLMFVLAHGMKEKPYVDLIANDKLGAWPATVNASSVWIGACFGQNSVKELNGASGNRYSTLPKDKFGEDGTAGRQAMIQGLTAELAKLKLTECDNPKKVCILSGVQDWIKK